MRVYLVSKLKLIKLIKII